MAVGNCVYGDVTAPAHDLPETPVEVAWYHWLWVWFAALILRLWLATLRIHANVPRIDDRDGPYVLLLWHDRLFTSSLVANRFLGRPVTALISTSKDGGWLVAFFRLMGIKAVRGSSSKRGAAALVSLTRAVRGGDHAGVTPDGPKGPRRAFKAGAVSLAKLTGRPFLIMGMNFRSAWTLRSWDQFALPKPFSRVDVTFEVVACPARDVQDAVVAEQLQVRLNELSGA
ncbi:MAG: hypothetical protein RIR91_1553 [Verrucomicrobiota bacterium]